MSLRIIPFTEKIGFYHVSQLPARQEPVLEIVKGEVEKAVCADGEAIDVVQELALENVAAAQVAMDGGSFVLGVGIESRNSIYGSSPPKKEWEK